MTAGRGGGRGLSRPRRCETDANFGERWYVKTLTGAWTSGPPVAADGGEGLERGTMFTDSQTSAALRSSLAPCAAVCLAAAIFLIDTLTPFDVAIAVLYVAVVMLSATFLGTRRLLGVGMLCVVLSLVSFVITHSSEYNLPAIIRCGVAISAIVITTFLSLKNQESNAALEAQAELLDLTHDAIFVRDADDVITYWNNGAEELYGWPRRDAVGRKAADLLKTVFPRPEEDIRAALVDEHRWEGELIHTRRDGTRLVVISRWSLKLDDRGRPAATMETNNDITEYRRAEDDLHKAQSELAHVTRLTTLGELTASIAHEVNQPLAATVTNGEACLRWLGRPVPDLGEARASVERMIVNARRASDVIARLRALSRRDDPVHMPLQINDTVEEALLLVERELSNHHITMALDLDPSLPEVFGDRVQLQQVVINLVVNAIQAMDPMPEEGRKLRILSRWIDDDACERPVQIEVRDSGTGFVGVDASQLFKTFYTTKHDGMGMGLSICRSIVEAHGGSISASTNDEGGACFRICLPATKEPSL